MIDAATFFSIVAAVLLAVLLGAALPVLLQLRSTLKTTQRFLDQLDVRLERTMKQLDGTARKVTELAEQAGGAVTDVRKVSHTAAGFAESLEEVRSSLRTTAVVAGAVAPAVLAAVKAWSASRQSPETEETQEGPGDDKEPAPVEEPAGPVLAATSD